MSSLDMNMQMPSLDMNMQMPSLDMNMQMPSLDMNIQMLLSDINICNSRHCLEKITLIINLVSKVVKKTSGRI